MIMMSLSLHTFVGSSLENDNSWRGEVKGREVLGQKIVIAFFFWRICCRYFAYIEFNELPVCCVCG